MSDPQFYLGRRYDLVRNEPSEEVLGYDPADLTTHAVDMTWFGMSRQRRFSAMILPI